MSVKISVDGESLLFAKSGIAVTRVDESISVTVRYQDLNLDSPEGVASLCGRIHTAALDVWNVHKSQDAVPRSELLYAYIYWPIDYR